MNHTERILLGKYPGLLRNTFSLSRQGGLRHLKPIHEDNDDTGGNSEEAIKAGEPSHAEEPEIQVPARESRQGDDFKPVLRSDLQPGRSGKTAKEQSKSPLQEKKTSEDDLGVTYDHSQLEPAVELKQWEEDVSEHLNNYSFEYQSEMSYRQDKLYVVHQPAKTIIVTSLQKARALLGMPKSSIAEIFGKPASQLLIGDTSLDGTICVMPDIRDEDYLRTIARPYKEDWFVQPIPPRQKSKSVSRGRSASRRSLSRSPRRSPKI